MDVYLDKIITLTTLYGLRVLSALAIFVIGRIVVSILVKGLEKFMKKTGMEETLWKFASNLARIFLLTVVIIAALGSLGIETTSLVAIIGAAGLAVGFALKDSLSNFSSGVMLIIFRPFKVGDFVEAGGTMGGIVEINIFNTILKTGDNKKVIVPNSRIMGANITNFSANETRRVDLVFGIGYNDDLKKAKETLNKLVEEDERILKEPAPVVAVSELADSSVNFIVRPWVKSADYWAVYWDMTERVKLTFDQEGITIPFPQQDVHIHTVEK
ncbi:MAG: mechanosensitive ion channel [Nitrospinae bacterium]|nr:mechanosensitive ion channel [Nitrospinota bacterium]